MTNSKYYKYPSEKIDIFKKSGERKDTQNFYLNILNNDYFKHSEQHQYLITLIIELNKKLKGRKNLTDDITADITNVVNYWLFLD